MHTCLLLAQQDPPAARQLCVSLQKTIALEKIWVYYTQAPLEVVLRRQQMADAGCPLEIPENRQTTPVPGQSIWLDAARLFECLTSNRGVRPAPSEVNGLLQTLSRADFSLLREAPPLLYHNDRPHTCPGSTGQRTSATPFGCACTWRVSAQALPRTRFS